MKPIFAVSAALILSLSAQSVLADPADIQSIDVVSRMLRSQEARLELKDKLISKIEVNQKKRPEGSLEFTLYVQSLEAGLGLDGVSTHPCTTVLVAVAKKLVATDEEGYTQTAPKVRTICAQNNPQF